MIEIGIRIKEVRNYYRLSQKNFAERLLVTPSYISMVENGKENPSQLFIKLISLEFHVSYEWLTSGNGAMFDLTEDIFNEQDKEIIEAIDTGLSSILKNMEQSLKKLTDLDRRNLSVVFVEINHIMNLKTTTPAQKSLLLEILKNLVGSTSMIIDRFAVIDNRNEFELERANQRFEEYIKENETILNKIRDLYLFIDNV